MRMVSSPSTAGTVAGKSCWGEVSGAVIHLIHFESCTILFQSLLPSPRVSGVLNLNPTQEQEEVVSLPSLHGCPCCPTNHICLSCPSAPSRTLSYLQIHLLPGSPLLPHPSSGRFVTESEGGTWLSPFLLPTPPGSWLVQNMEDKVTSKT